VIHQARPVLTPSAVQLPVQQAVPVAYAAQAQSAQAAQADGNAPVAALTSGIPDPATIAKQKDTYAKQLEDQLNQGTKLLQTQHDEMLAKLRQECQTKKAMYHLQVDQQVKLHEKEFADQYHDNMMNLQHTVQQHRTMLDIEATKLHHQYNHQKTQQDFHLAIGQKHKETSEAQVKIHSELAKMNPSLPTLAVPSASFAATPTTPFSVTPVTHAQR